MTLNKKLKNTFQWGEKNPCFNCNSECCKDVAVQFETPKTKKDWDEIRWLVAHKNVQVYKDLENDWMIEFFTECEELDENGLCKIHENRPQTCYEHSHETCIYYNKDSYYKIIFRKLEDVEKYLKEREEKSATRKNKKRKTSQHTLNQLKK